MADIRAFRPLTYHTGIVGDLGPVVAPPYDVIPENRLPELRGRSPYNVVHLTRPGSDYEAAAETEDRWIAEGALKRDQDNALFLHEVEFDGRKRRDLLAALRLQPYSDGVVLPHERTHRGPKEDRLALMRATRTALEPLWFLYDGAKTELPRLLASGFAKEPALTFTDEDRSRHRVWRITSADWTEEVRAAFAALPILIADGHHRYETALAYADEVGGDADAASRFTLALLTDLADPGLEVLPTHRVLKAGVAVTGGEQVGSLEEMLRALDGDAAGYYRERMFHVLHFETGLPVVELHRQVIENILGKRSLEENVEYTRDAQEAVRWVDEGRGVAAFFLARPDLAAVLNEARAGRTMPQKTTYFFPKPPSGMLFLELAPDRGL